MFKKKKIKKRKKYKEYKIIDSARRVRENGEKFEDTECTVVYTLMRLMING